MWVLLCASHCLAYINTFNPHNGTVGGKMMLDPYLLNAMKQYHREIE